jgi:hypothetical protein
VSFDTLICPSAEEGVGDGLEEDADVEGQRPVFDVVDVEQAQFVEGEVGTAAYLP